MNCLALWRDNLDSGGKSDDFFTSVSAAWWNAKLPPHKVDSINEQIRGYFERYKVTQITQDVILAYGRKP
jgi:hypothetical protein